MSKLHPGARPPKGSTVYLCNGHLHEEHEVERFEADDRPGWVCPETASGFWYDYVTKEEREAKAVSLRPSVKRLQYAAAELRGLAATYRERGDIAAGMRGATDVQAAEYDMAYDFDAVAAWLDAEAERDVEGSPKR